MPAQSPFYREHPKPPIAEPGPVRGRLASINREFDKGFATAIEDYRAGKAEPSVSALNAQFGPRYTEGYRYGWLEAQCKRMGVTNFRQPQTAKLGCHQRTDGLVTCTD